MAMDNNSIKKLLQNRGLKATKSRVDLLIKMQDYSSAMSYSAIQKQMSPIDRVTLYRTLERLKENGIIHIAFQENNETYYAICGNSCDENHHQHEHVHFKCTKCNTVTCEKLISKIEVLLPNYLIDKISVNIEGLCQLCR